VGLGRLGVVELGEIDTCHYQHDEADQRNTAEGIEKAVRMCGDWVGERSEPEPFAQPAT
jgi:hypothetical protein